MIFAYVDVDFTAIEIMPYNCTPTSGWVLNIQKSDIKKTILYDLPISSSNVGQN